MRLSFQFVPAIVLALVTVFVAGCASDERGRTAGRGLPAGQTCTAIRADLDKLDRRGVGQRASAANEGRRLTPTQRAEVETYNRLLTYYLAGQCHV